MGQFDRVAFKQATERLFDSRFGYDREIKESFKYANTLKHGSYEQKQEVKEQQKQEQAVKIERQQSHHHGKGLFDILLDGQSVYVAPAQDDHTKRRRKKKRGHNLDQSHGQSIR